MLREKGKERERDIQNISQTFTQIQPHFNEYKSI